MAFAFSLQCGLLPLKAKCEDASIDSDIQHSNHADKKLLPPFYFFLLGGLLSCGSLPQSSMNAINLRSGVATTNIRIKTTRLQGYSLPPRQGGSTCSPA